jgi:hypothetical protein
MMNRELLGDASKMKINLLTAHFISLQKHQPPHRTASRSTYGCPSDGEYTDDSNGMLNEEERLLMLLAYVFCDVQSVDRALQDHPICKEREKKKRREKR